jgi:two-component system nitrogen regulation sensor histidine kinase NtrY
MSFFKRTVLFILLPVLITVGLMTLMQYRSLNKVYDLYQPDKTINLLKETQKAAQEEYQRRKHNGENFEAVETISASINERLLAFEEIDILNKEIRFLMLLNSSLIPLIVISLILLAIIYLAANFFRPIERLTRSIQSYTAGNKDVFPLQVTGSQESRLLLKTTNNFVATIDQQNRKIAVQSRFLGWRNSALEIAHVIKNTLVPAKLSAETILESALDNKNPLLKQNISRVLQSLQTLEIMSKSMRDLSSMHLPQLQNLDLYALANESVVFYKKQFSAITLKGSSIIVAADAQQIRSVIDNLIVNAIDACKNVVNGQISINIFSGNIPYFECRDNGSGIDPSIRDKIFKLNFTTKKNGSGFGLYFVKKVVEDHGYSLECFSDNLTTETVMRVVFNGKNPDS